MIEFCYKQAAIIQTNALLDSGSDITLIHRKMVYQLKLKTCFKENLKLSSALCNSDDLMSSLVNFEISSVLNNKFRKISAYTVNQLHVPDNKVNISNLKKQFNFPTFQNSEVTLLIGTNRGDFLIHKNFRVRKERVPLPVETLLGWTIMGGSCNVHKKGVTKQELIRSRKKL